MRSWLLGLLAFGLGLLVARWAFSGESEVRAARSPAICVGTGCYNVKRYYDNAYVCSFKYTCPDPCLNPSAIPCSSWVCGQIGTAYYVEEIVACYEPTPTPPPPPVLSLEVLCDAWGTGGWCRANGRLRATGQDPAGGTVTVSGSLGDPAGTPVQCSGSGTCTATVPLPEGRGTAQVTATSQYGQAPGSQAWKYDPTPPQMTYSLNPASPDGQNGWYVTAPVVTVQGSDATSGIAAL